MGAVTPLAMIGVAGAADAVERASPAETSPPTEERVLIEPEPGFPGVELGRVEIGPVRRLTPTYWTGVLVSPSGQLVRVESNPGDVPPARGGERLSDRFGNDVIESTGLGTSILRFDVGCGWAAVELPDDLSAAEERAVLDNVAIVLGGGLAVTVPEGWASFGGGFLGPMISRQLTVEIGGRTVELRLTQHFETPFGALMRVPDLDVIDVGGDDALVYGAATGSPTVAVMIGDDTATVSGAATVDELAEVAATLGPHGPAFALPDSVVLPSSPTTPEPACPATLA